MTVPQPLPHSSPLIAGSVLPIKRAEELLATLPGVIAARIIASDNGAVDEIHVLTTSEVTPKQTVRNIESALIAHLGMRVDHRKISVATTLETGQSKDAAREAAKEKERESKERETKERETKEREAKLVAEAAASAAAAASSSLPDGMAPVSGGGAGAYSGADSGVSGGGGAGPGGAAAGADLGGSGGRVLLSSSAMIRRIEARISSMEGSCAFAV